MMADHHITLSLYELCIDTRRKKKKIFVNFEKIEAEMQEIKQFFEAINKEKK